MSAPLSPDPSPPTFAALPWEQDMLLQMRQMFAADREKRASHVANPLSPLDHTRICQRIEKLTPRQREVLDLVVRGAQDKEIARELGISEPTVSNHIYAVMSSLEVENRTALCAVYHGTQPYSPKRLG